MRQRAERRLYLAKAKRRARDQLRLWRLDSREPPMSGREVGRAAAMHCTCPCGLCANPRLFGEKSLRERSDEVFFDNRAIRY